MSYVLNMGAVKMCLIFTHLSYGGGGLPTPSRTPMHAVVPLARFFGQVLSTDSPYIVSCIVDTTIVILAVQPTAEKTVRFLSGDVGGVDERHETTHLRDPRGTGDGGGIRTEGDMGRVGERTERNKNTASASVTPTPPFERDRDGRRRKTD